MLGHVLRSESLSLRRQNAEWKGQELVGDRALRWYTAWRATTWKMRRLASLEAWTCLKRQGTQEIEIRMLLLLLFASSSSSSYSSSSSSASSAAAASLLPLLLLLMVWFKINVVEWIARAPLRIASVHLFSRLSVCLFLCRQNAYTKTRFSQKLSNLEL